MLTHMLRGGNSKLPVSLQTAMFIDVLWTVWQFILIYVTHWQPELKKTPNWIMKGPRPDKDKRPAPTKYFLVFVWIFKSPTICYMNVVANSFWNESSSKTKLSGANVMQIGQ